MNQDLEHNQADSAPLRLLAVDDDPIQREIAASSLSEAGFVVTTAEDGAVGWQLLQEQPFDLVLLDLDMPGIDGFGVLERMQKDERLRHVPVIVATGRDDHGAIENCFELGAESFVVKPIHWGLLLYQIRFVLRAVQMREALRVARQAAQSAASMKDSLLSVMGHELRTPLHLMIGFAEVMAQGAQTGLRKTEVENYSQQIIEGGHRLLSTLSNAMLFARVLSGEVTTQQGANCMAGEIIDGLVTKFSKEAVEAGLTLKVEAEALEDTELAVSEDLLIRCLGLLVDNAIKYAPAESAVTLSLSATRKGGLAFLVTDHGPGIPPERLGEALRPFVQLQQAHTREKEGMGLGLALANALAQAYGGRLVLQPTSPRGPGAPGLQAILMLPKERVQLPEDYLKKSAVA